MSVIILGDRNSGRATIAEALSQHSIEVAADSAEDLAEVYGVDGIIDRQPPVILSPTCMTRAYRDQSSCEDYHAPKKFKTYTPPHRKNGRGKFKRNKK